MQCMLKYGLYSCGPSVTAAKVLGRCVHTNFCILLKNLDCHLITISSVRVRRKRQNLSQLRTFVKSSLQHRRRPEVISYHINITGGMLQATSLGQHGEEGTQQADISGFVLHQHQLDFLPLGFYSLFTALSLDIS